MKRLWPLPVLLLLALPLRAQEGGEAAPSSDSAPVPDSAVQEPAGQADGAENADAPPPDAGPVAEPNSSESQPPQDSAEGAPVKEEPLISVKVVASPAEEGDEESVAPAAPKKKVVPTATLMKAPKKGKPSAVKGSKLSKGKKGEKAVPAAVKTKAPAVAAEPPPPPVPAVPLTPITPRNP